MSFQKCILAECQILFQIFLFFFIFFIFWVAVVDFCTAPVQNKNCNRYRRKRRLTMLVRT